MITNKLLTSFVLIVTLTSPIICRAEPYEKTLKIPKCKQTNISEISARLGEIINGKFIPADPKEVGTAISYSNKTYGVSYDYVPAISERSRIGDPVKLCLISYYTHCPEGDDRGKIYKAINLRTKETWSLSDAEHICGGA